MMAQEKSFVDVIRQAQQDYKATLWFSVVDVDVKHAIYDVNQIGLFRDEVLNHALMKLYQSRNNNMSHNLKYIMQAHRQFAKSRNIAHMLNCLNDIMAAQETDLAEQHDINLDYVYAK